MARRYRGTTREPSLARGTGTRGRLPEARVNRDAAAVGDPLCEDETPDGTFTNKIAIGKRGEIARLAKSFNVAQRGALLAPTSHLPVVSTGPPPLRNEFLSDWEAEVRSLARIIHEVAVDGGGRHAGSV